MNGKRYSVTWAPFIAPPEGEDFQPDWKEERFETYRAAKVRAVEILSSGLDAFGSATIDHEKPYEIERGIWRWHSVKAEHWANWKGSVVCEETVAR